MNTLLKLDRGNFMKCEACFEKFWINRRYHEAEAFFSGFSSLSVF